MLLLSSFNFSLPIIFLFAFRGEECPPTQCSEHLLVQNEGLREKEEEKEEEEGPYINTGKQK